MQRHAAIFGASGYTGLELTKILAGHPSVELSVASSDRWQGERVRDHLPVSGPAADVHYRPPAAALDRASTCQVAFLCTPTESSVELVPKLLDKGVKLVIDLSGGYRLKDPALYPKFYGFAHHHPGLLEGAVYGLPELFGEQIPGTRLIANPGCYPTASMLAVAPLISKKLCEPALIVDAKSGVTGAGRKASEEHSFSEVAENFHAYRVGKHQHAPEIIQGLSRIRHEEVALTFTAHLLPIRRGLLATCYAKLAPDTDPDSVDGAVAHYWEGSRFVRHVPEAEHVTLNSVVGTNYCFVAAKVDPATRVVTAIAAIDNLLKGAAGQAVQNMNLAFGLDETSGLTDLKGKYP